MKTLLKILIVCPYLTYGQYAPHYVQSSELSVYSYSNIGSPNNAIDGNNSTTASFLIQSSSIEINFPSQYNKVDKVIFRNIPNSKFGLQYWNGSSYAISNYNVNSDTEYIVDKATSRLRIYVSGFLAVPISLGEIEIYADGYKVIWSAGVSQNKIPANQSGWFRITAPTSNQTYGIGINGGDFNYKYLTNKTILNLPDGSLQQTDYYSNSPRLLFPSGEKILVHRGSGYLEIESISSSNTLGNYYNQSSYIYSKDLRLDQTYTPGTDIICSHPVDGGSRLSSSSDGVGTPSLEDATNVYPNPTKGDLNVVIDNKEVSLDISKEAKGTYILSIIDINGKTILKRVIKE